MCLIPAATNFPTAANAVRPRVFNLFDLYTAKHLPGGADPSNYGFQPIDKQFSFLRYHSHPCYKTPMDP